MIGWVLLVDQIPNVLVSCYMYLTIPDLSLSSLLLYIEVGTVFIIGVKKGLNRRFLEGFKIYVAKWYLMRTTSLVVPQFSLLPCFLGWKFLKRFIRGVLHFIYWVAYVFDIDCYDMWCVGKLVPVVPIIFI